MADYRKTGIEIKTGHGEVVRIKLPKGNEVIGIVETRLGANKMLVRCFDGNSRVCRIPGKYNKRLWVRPRDVVLVQPWEFKGNEKGDLIYKYSKAAIQWLKHKGMFKPSEIV